MTRLWNLVRRAWQFGRRREWVLFVTVITAVIAEVTRQIDAGLALPDWRTLLLIVAGVLARQGVFSVNSVENLKNQE